MAARPTEITRKASTIVADLELFLAGGQPRYPAIAAAHGWPDVAKVRENIAALKPFGDLTVTFDIHEEAPVTAPPSPTRPTPQPPRVTSPAPVSAGPDTIANLLAAAHQHDRATIRNKAARIDALLTELRQAFKADRADQARRKEIADLEARLAELKRGEHRCGHDGCGRTFTSKQAAALHVTRTHGGAA